MLNFSRCTFRQAPTKLKETLYKSNAQCLGPLSKIKLDEALERMQAWAARFMTSSGNFTVRSADIRSELPLPVLAYWRKYPRLSLFHNIFSNRTCIDKKKYVRQLSYVSFRTDHSLKLDEYAARMNVFKYAFFPTMHEWNSLSEEVCAPPSSFLRSLYDF